MKMIFANGSCHAGRKYFDVWFSLTFISALFLYFFVF